MALYESGGRRFQIVGQIVILSLFLFEPGSIGLCFIAWK